MRTLCLALTLLASPSFAYSVDLTGQADEYISFSYLYNLSDADLEEGYTFVFDSVGEVEVPIEIGGERRFMWQCLVRLKQVEIDANHRYFEDEFGGPLVKLDEITYVSRAALMDEIRQNGCTEPH